MPMAAAEVERSSAGRCRPSSSGRPRRRCGPRARASSQRHAPANTRRFDAAELHELRAHALRRSRTRAVNGCACTHTMPAGIITRQLDPAQPHVDARALGRRRARTAAARGGAPRGSGRSRRSPTRCEPSSSSRHRQLPQRVLRQELGRLVLALRERDRREGNRDPLLQKEDPDAARSWGRGRRRCRASCPQSYPGPAAPGSTLPPEQHAAAPAALAQGGGQPGRRPRARARGGAPGARRPSRRAARSSETERDPRDVCAQHRPGELAGMLHAQAVRDRARHGDLATLARGERERQVGSRRRARPRRSRARAPARAARPRSRPGAPARHRAVEAVERLHVLQRLERARALTRRDQRDGRTAAPARALLGRDLRRARARRSLSAGTITISAPSAAVRADLERGRVFGGRDHRARAPARAPRAPPPARGSRTSARPRPPSPRGKVVIRLNAPRSLNAPVGCSDSALQKSSSSGRGARRSTRRAQHVRRDPAAAQRGSARGRAPSPRRWRIAARSARFDTDQGGAQPACALGRETEHA